jgi:hypothetical protein
MLVSARLSLRRPRQLALPGPAFAVRSRRYKPPFAIARGWAYCPVSESPAAGLETIGQNLAILVCALSSGPRRDKAAAADCAGCRSTSSNGAMTSRPLNEQSIYPQSFKIGRLPANSLLSSRRTASPQCSWPALSLTLLKIEGQ